MKKVLAICLMMVLVVSMSVTAFAAPNAFISSPSKNLAPEVVEGKNEDDDCTATLVITAYADRHELSEDIRLQFEKAYEEIAKAADLTLLNSDLKKVADEVGVKAENLSVSDLFDINYENCGDHEDHGHFDIVLKADTLKHFVGLLHLKDGDWELVKNAEVKEVNGELHLVFAVEDFSPFAIVVDNSKEQSVSPETGDSGYMTVCLIVMAVSALAIVVIAAKIKKQAA